MEANKRWLSLPEDFRNQLIRNSFCSNCKGAVTYTDFIIVDHPLGVLLEGKCKNCESK